MGGFLPVPGQTIYGASKAAVKLLTEGLHAECSGTNVHVTVVFPGAVATNITTNSGVDIPIVAGDGRAAGAPHVRPPTKAARDHPRRHGEGRLPGAHRQRRRSMDALYRVNPRRAAGFIANQMRDLLGD